MSLRVILCPLFGSDADQAALHAGCRIARRFEGQLDALFVRPDPGDLVPLVGEGISPAILSQLMDATRAELDRRAGVARQQFEAACREVGLEEGRGAAWRELEGSRADVVVRQSCVADLIVLAGPAPGEDPERRPILEEVLLESGRPLLLVPPSWTDSIGHTIAIAWNGRAEAARAVSLALPFLMRAQSVHILTADTRRTPFDVSVDLATYLAHHGVTSARHHVDITATSVGEALAHQAAALGADLLVMGGYGRSRLTELVLGGVTRHVITHLDRPVLLAH